MATVLPYINFADKGREAIEFYKAIFGGDAEVQLVKDSPMADKMPAEWGERIMHLDFKGDNNIHFLGSDVISDQPGLERGNGYQITIECDSTEQLHGFYDKLVVGGTESFPPVDSEWNSVFAQLTDKFGVQWMLDFQK